MIVVVIVVIMSKSNKGTKNPGPVEKPTEEETRAESKFGLLYILLLKEPSLSKVSLEMFSKKLTMQFI